MRELRHEVPVAFAADHAASKRKNRRRRRRRRSIIHEFCSNTTAHALPRIAQSENRHNRLFWAISFIIFTSIMVYFIITAIIGYFRYPTNLDINFVSEWPQYFPAVSFCNISPFRLDKFAGPFLNFAINSNLTSVNAPPFHAYEFINIQNFAIHNINQNQTNNEYFFPLSSILYNCTFNNRVCIGLNNFTSFTSSSYGLCHTFNANLKDKTRSVHFSNEFGGEGSLELEFYVHTHQYVPNIYNAYGMVAIVHDNAEIPLIEKSGIYLVPGRKHKISYRKKGTFFLPPPYTKCTDKISPMMQALFQNFDGVDYRYSQMICNQLCAQIYIYEQCACVNPSFWTGRAIPKHGTDELFTAPLCNRSNNCYETAMDTLWSSFDLMEKYCSNCSSQCKITDFKIQISSLSAPPEWRMPSIYEFVNRTSIPLSSNWATQWPIEIMKNYIAINVVRETNVVQNDTQSATMNFVDVISNIGGQTGLWIGISFLSVMEVAEMFYRLIRNEFYRISGN